MDEILIPFSKQDEKDLQEFKRAISSDDPVETLTSSGSNLNRKVITLPEIEARSVTKEEIEEALSEGKKLPRGNNLKLPDEVIEGAKAAFISSGGNISEVAALYDLTPEAVLRLASKENWPVYNGTTKLHESKSKGQLLSLQAKLWSSIEAMLNALDVEKKAKDDITQHRQNSEYVEPLNARSGAFKILMDQYMRVSTLLEPELFAGDPDGSNFNARKAREDTHPGGIEGVNRELADFFSQVVVGIADRIADREMEGYGEIIDARAQ